MNCAPTVAEIVEAIAMLERVKSAARLLDFHTFLDDAILARENQFGRDVFTGGRMQLVVDRNSGAREHAQEIAELMDIPYEVSIVAAREFTCGTRATIVLKALREFVALMDEERRRQ